MNLDRFVSEFGWKAERRKLLKTLIKKKKKKAARKARNKIVRTLLAFFEF